MSSAMASSKRPVPDWAAIRVAYDTDAMTLCEIETTFKIRRDELYKRAREEGWQRRIDRQAAAKAITAAAGALPQVEDVPAPQTSMQKRAALAARLFHALEERILAIEEESMTHDPSHGERDARALSAMARALEQLGDMLDQAELPAAKPEEEEIDADEFRRLLTDRLDRLRRSGSSS